MSLHTANVEWSRGDARFLDNRYSRRHVWRFDGGVEVPGSSSPHSVPLPYSDPQAVDPEEAFVASIASCHMLWFLSLTAERGFIVDSYEDDAVGTMGRVGSERFAVTDVVLRPAIVFGGATQPNADEIASLHEAAHERCFIANSVKTAIRVEARP